MQYMKSVTESLRKAPKSRNFDVLYAFSVCHRCANIWFETRIIIINIVYLCSDTILRENYSISPEI